MQTISWELTQKQEKYIHDKHKYLLVEGSALEAVKPFLQFIKFLFIL